MIPYILDERLFFLNDPFLFVFPASLLDSNPSLLNVEWVSASDDKGEHADVEEEEEEQEEDDEADENDVIVFIIITIYHLHHHYHLQRFYYITGRVVTLPVDYYITCRCIT